MSFYQDPLVDDNSKRSEESVNAVKSLFTRKKGFISREENPDFGVDIDVELIAPGKGASSKKFAIQIKSTAVAKESNYNNEAFLTLQFKTSRLGYLARREPAYGIIILYDEISQTCYFDYVEEIIKRLDELGTREGWRKQETVAILIPKKVLDEEQLRYIHEKFTSRHDNSHLLLRTHGPKFNIPIFDSLCQHNAINLDIHNSNDVADFLEKHGGLLYNEHEFGQIIQLLGKINRSQISKSPELIFLAAITHTQQGDIIEAEYYIRKAGKVAGKLSSEQNNNIEFSKIRLEFLKGNIERVSFLGKLRDIASKSNQIVNQLIIDINVVFLELASSVVESRFEPKILAEISALFERIEIADIDEEKRHQLKVYHSENQHNFAVQAFITYYSDFKVKESLKIEVAQVEKLRYASQTILLTNAAEKALRESYLFSIAKKRPLLKATSAHQMAKNFLSLRSAFSMLAPDDRMDIDPEKMIKMFSDFHDLAIIGYGIFTEMHLLQNSHESLTTAYEIQKLCLVATGKLIGSKPAEYIMTIIRLLESDYDFQPFESAVEKFYKPNHQRDPINILMEASDDVIEGMSKKYLNAYNLPENRLENIVESLKMRKIFHQRCSNPDIELLEDLRHNLNFSTRFIVVPPCILRDKSTGRQTVPSTDIEVLLNEFSDIINKKQQ